MFCPAEKLMRVSTTFFYQLFIFICGFLAVQRFALGSLSAYVCMLLFICFIVHIFRAHKNKALTALALGMFFLVDNGAEIYAETPAILRYAIYLSAIICLFFLKKHQIASEKFLGCFLIIGCVLMGSLFSFYGDVPIDMQTLDRDLKVILILCAFLFVRDSSQLDLQLLYVGVLGALIGEIFNGLFLYQSHHDYMSYSSTKSLIIFPVMYAVLLNKSLATKMILCVATAYVLFLYTSRMLILSLFLLILVGFIWGFIKKIKFSSLFSKKSYSFFMFLMLGYLFVNFLSTSEYAGLKSVVLIRTVFDGISGLSEVADILKSIDATRFYEHQIFFKRTLLEVAFGNGLGSGIRDVDGLLNFVSFDDTAFSYEEIASSTYFNFHDFWIDFGLRFGLIAVIYLIYCLAFKPMCKGNTVQGVLFGVVLINASFSMAGILLIALLVRFWPVENYFESKGFGISSNLS